MTTELNWTEVGAEVLTERFTTERGKAITRSALEEVIARLVWEQTGGVVNLPFAAGAAIRTAIAEFRIPKVSAVAIGYGLAPYALYGIEGNFTNGRARIYLIDAGDSLIPVASHLVEPKEVHA